jgi:uncharacterized membrane protein
MQHRQLFPATSCHLQRYYKCNASKESRVTQKMTQGPEDIAPFEDPIVDDPAFQQTESRVAIWGHPLHAMTVAFPVALTFCAFGADLLYWWSGQERWAWAALWATGTAFLFGLLAGASGTMELLMVPGIRIRAAAWTHFVIAVMLLSVLGLNWGWRLTGYESAILPWGILMSGFAVVIVAATGWHGGKLVFDYGLGVSKGN